MAFKEYMTPKVKTIAFFTIIFILAIFLYKSSFVFHRYGAPEIPETLIVGTCADYKPVCFVDEKGNLTGFDIDIACQVATRLERNIEFVDMPFEALIPQLQAGALHMIAAGLSPTEERKKVMFFSNPYQKSNSLVAISLRDDLVIHNNSDLTKYVVVVNQGYFAADILHKIEGLELVELPSLAEGLQALRAGRADLLILEPHAIPAIQDAASQKFTIYQLDACQNSTALGISRIYEFLVDACNDALRSMKEDGTLNQLCEKWGIVHD